MPSLTVGGHDRQGSLRRQAGHMDALASLLQDGKPEHERALADVAVQQHRGLILRFPKRQPSIAIRPVIVNDLNRYRTRLNFLKFIRNRIRNETDLQGNMLLVLTAVARRQIARGELLPVLRDRHFNGR